MLWLINDHVRHSQIFCKLFPQFISELDLVRVKRTKIIKCFTSLWDWHKINWLITQLQIGLETLPIRFSLQFSQWVPCTVYSTLHTVQYITLQYSTVHTVNVLHCTVHYIHYIQYSTVHTVTVPTYSTHYIHYIQYSIYCDWQVCILLSWWFL